ncbi:dehydrogenase/reductase SDR family member on chromosome X-like [Liolophura sinensis]|uniref:dehydrogenase/reductase SDR family member on chromosome X-like n=1 Tax=Liolophura sinensis TaxID=3198878 RepID=UPI0031588697
MGATLSLSDVQPPLNRVAVVTGANQGLGLETAKQLACLGCKVVLGCRSEERALKAIEDIKTACAADGITEPDLRFIPLDLSNLQSVHDFCVKFKDTGLPLHILICNAAVFGIPQSFTADGYETHFQVNYLSHLLMTLLLLPVLMDSGPDCRIVNVSAKLHLFASLEMDNIHGEKAYGRVGFYSKSKLYQIMSMYALQRRITNSHVTISSLHPGVIETNIQQGIMDDKTWFGWFNRGLKMVYSLPPVKYLLHKTGFMRGADSAALSIVYMAVSPKLAGIKCLYYDETVPRATSAESRREERQEMLLDYSLQCIEKYVPGETLEELNLKK